MHPFEPRPVATVAALWPYLPATRVGARQPVARLLPAARGRCGLYLLTYADGSLQAGQATNVVASFTALRKNGDDLVEMHFWHFARTGLDSAERSAVRALREAGFALRHVPAGSAAA